MLTIRRRFMEDGTTKELLFDGEQYIVRDFDTEQIVFTTTNSKTAYKFFR